jgi:cytochrome c peroxidase
MRSLPFKHFSKPAFAAFILAVALFYLGSCHKDHPIVPVPTGDLVSITYNPQAYTIQKPSFFPNVDVPADNPMTVEGVQLGRRLFYDPILSGDSTQSCSSCHGPKGNFTDNKPVSKGIDGILGTRSAMSLLNVAYVDSNLFWDGRAHSIEDQALKPVENVIEMHNTWDNVLVRLKRNPDYPSRFRKAFGISDRSEITKELAAKAIAQFERTFISSGNSKYDQYVFQGNKDAFDDDEVDGYQMFFDQGQKNGLNLPDAQCFHCHGVYTLTEGNKFFNNGLDTVSTYAQLLDIGLYATNPGKEANKGKFRAPTLRNIEFSAPYMHDGRFQTLEQVLDMYSADHGKLPNVDPFIHQVGFPLGNGKYSGFTPGQKVSIIKFLKTLSDTTSLKNPAFLNPF